MHVAGHACDTLIAGGANGVSFHHFGRIALLSCRKRRNLKFDHKGQAISLSPLIPPHRPF